MQSIKNRNRLWQNIKVEREPFGYFEINDFVSEDFYQALKKEWPKLEEYPAKTSMRHIINSVHEQFPDFIADKKTWEVFIDYFSSYEFISNIEKLVKPSLWDGHGTNVKKKWIPISRGLTDNYFLRRASLKIFELFPFIRDRFFFEVKTKVAFSTIQNGDEITPHNDDSRKLVSLMFYVVDDKWKQEYGGDTKYFVAKNEKFKKKWEKIASVENHLSDDKRKKFYEDMDVLCTNEYLDNKMVVFVKNDFSWHAVSKINCPAGMGRGAFLVNLRR